MPLHITPAEVSSALKSCDWSNTPIGNKFCLIAAVEYLDALVPQPIQPSKENPFSHDISESQLVKWLEELQTKGLARTDMALQIAAILHR